MAFEIEVDEIEFGEGPGLGEFDSDFDERFDEIDFPSLGIDPDSPTEAKPGTEEKVLMLAARYAAGVPLWHDKDCYDHTPIAEH